MYFYEGQAFDRRGEVDPVRCQGSKVSGGRGVVGRSALRDFELEVREVETETETEVNKRLSGLLFRDVYPSGPSPASLSLPVGVRSDRVSLQ